MWTRNFGNGESTNTRPCSREPLGLHGVFQSPPQPDTLTREFVRYYHRFADHLFACRQQLFPFTRLHSFNFEFDLYTSAEYSRMLEQEWGAS